VTIEILPQPDDSTCGPTCLHAVYAHYDDDLPLARVIAEVAPLPEGGTLAVMLASHALARGYDTTIYTYNLTMFDPTWFADGGLDLTEALTAQRRVKPDPKLRLATDAYLSYLTAGGEICYRELGIGLLTDLLSDDTPVLTGLSATYLYGCARENGTRYDAIAGVPVGHFVVLSDYDSDDHTLAVADPLHSNPRFESSNYRVSAERLIGAIMLGVFTYDANLLVVRPR